MKHNSSYLPPLSLEKLGNLLSPQLAPLWTRRATSAWMTAKLGLVSAFWSDVSDSRLTWPVCRLDLASSMRDVFSPVAAVNRSWNSVNQSPLHAVTHDTHLQLKKVNNEATRAFQQTPATKDHVTPRTSKCFHVITCFREASQHDNKQMTEQVGYSGR